MRVTRVLLQVCLVVGLLVGCGHGPPEQQLSTVGVAHAPDTVTTMPPVTTTTTDPPRPAPHVLASRTRAPAPQYAGALDAAFWRRLANCESRYGASGAYVGYFQLTWANAARVGIGPSSSYDEQLAGAQRWLAIIGGRGGTTAGWPVCWYVAMRGA